MKASFLRSIYGGLALIALVASSKAMIWPRLPSVQPLTSSAIANSLRQRADEIAPLPTLPAHRSSDLATSPILAYRLPGGFELRLARGQVRHRFNMQTAVIANSNPQLKLKTRSLNSTSMASAIGANAGRWTRQTCFVADPERSGGDFAVTKDELTLIVDRFSSSRSQKLKALFGLAPNRSYQCVLVSVSSQPGKAVLPQSQWNALLQSLRPALGS